MTKPVWKLRSQDKETVQPGLVHVCDDQPLLAELLALRGITDPAEAEAFLKLENYTPTSGKVFPGMEEAVARIIKAIAAEEPILIYGDFDVDGITGTSILTQALTMVQAKVSYYVPDRHAEGHGLHSASLCRLISARKVKLVITTDTGSTNFNEVMLLKNLGVETIITDHHELSEHLPPALAVLNPKLLPAGSPLGDLCGAGVAYKLCECLFEALDRPQADKDVLLDLTAIGTVVDMVPLLHENRYLVWRGLQVLQRRERPGLKALLFEANINETAPLDTQTLGFAIGPRLNAIGRLTNATEGVELLLTEDPERAKQLAAKLEQLNRKRKELVEQVVLQAQGYLAKTGELGEEKAIIMASPDWNPGIIGLVATKLIEQYHCPCFLGAIDEAEGIIRFSARSIPGFDMHNQLLPLEDLFIRWGGHSGAAGFSLAQENLAKLKERLFKICRENIHPEQMDPLLEIDRILTPNQVNPYLVELVNRMAPFGQGNPLPVFALEKMSLGAQRTMGDSNRHLKVILATSEPGQYLEAIRWNWGPDAAKLDPSVCYRLAFTAELNAYNGTTKVQLIVKDIQADTPSHGAGMQKITVVSDKSPAIVSTLSPSVEGKGRSPEWVDHRVENRFEAVLAEWMSSEAAMQSFSVFCEGNQSFFPLPEVPFFGRHGGGQTPVEQLILWDLPPDLVSLGILLETNRPQRIHLVGGKYQRVPLSRPPTHYLEGLLRLILRQQQGNSLSLSLSTLTHQLATSTSVVLTALTVLNRLDTMTFSTLPEAGRIQVTLLKPDAALPEDIATWVEYMSFEAALQSVCRFRNWLMTAPLDMIQSAVAVEMMQPHLEQHPHERKTYAHHNSVSRS